MFPQPKDCRSRLQRAKSSNLQPVPAPDALPMPHRPPQPGHPARPLFHSPRVFPGRLCSPKHQRKDTETAESSVSFQPSFQETAIQQYGRMVQILEEQGRNLREKKRFLLSQQWELERQNAQMEKAIVGWEEKLRGLRPKRKQQQIDIENELERYIQRGQAKECGQSTQSTREGFRT